MPEILEPGACPTGSGYSAEPEPLCVSAVPASTPSADRFYIDCEFDGHGGRLLSIAIVPESQTGLSVHIRTREAATDPWVIANVEPLMDSHDADLIWLVDINGVGDCIRNALEHCERPVIIADSPVDIGRFCAAISTSNDGGWASCDYPLMRFEVHNVDCYPTDLPGAVQHNAWWDAMALRHVLRAREEEG